MKLKSSLMMFTAAAALSANMAFAAIDPQTLADAYIKEGYTYVEVTVGPTQTKLEAVKGDRKVEVIYDNASGDVIKQDFEDADSEYQGKTGVEIKNSAGNFEDGDDDEGDDSDEADDDDENDDSDEGDDDESDDSDDDSDESDDSDDSDESDDEGSESKDEGESADDEGED